MSLATFTLTTLTTLVPSITPSTTTVLRYDDGELERAIEGQKRECLIKMTWNWHTVDACFLAERWQVRSAGHMAMICISVLLLAVLLEAFRRLVKEYDHYLIRRHKKRLPGSSDPLYPAARGMDFELTGLANPPPTNPPATNPPPTNTLPTSLSPKPITNKPVVAPDPQQQNRPLLAENIQPKPLPEQQTPQDEEGVLAGQNDGGSSSRSSPSHNRKPSQNDAWKNKHDGHPHSRNNSSYSARVGPIKYSVDSTGIPAPEARKKPEARPYRPYNISLKKKYKVYRPSFGAQLLRALLRAMHFAIAYIVMLLGMYYNGYILLCIFLGVFFGFLLFHWTRLEEGSKHDIDHADEATGCCCG